MSDSRSLRSALRTLLAVLACALLGACASYPDRLGSAGEKLQPLPIPATPEAFDAHPANGAIWQSGTNVALFEDTRAHRIGDLITVQIQENANATKFGGNGAVAQSNTFTTTLQATVVRVMSDGNLEISGQKEVMLNGGHEFIRIVGVVRAADVTQQNTVLSTQIADARVEYSGNGSVYAAAQTPWLTNFFLSLWPF